jgi:hypothetical protein
VNARNLVGLAAYLLCGGCIVQPPYGYVPPSVRTVAARDTVVLYSQRFAEDCPLPDPLTYNHAVQLRAPGELVTPLTPEILREWVDGCAILRFTVDERGHVASVQTVSASPPGAVAAASDILRLNRFANTGDAGPGSPMLVRIGMAHTQTGGTVLVLGFR